jgi:hypothetical protein
MADRAADAADEISREKRSKIALDLGNGGNDTTSYPWPSGRGGLDSAPTFCPEAKASFQLNPKTRLRPDLRRKLVPFVIAP